MRGGRREHVEEARARRVSEGRVDELALDVKAAAAPIYYAKNLFPSILLNLALQVISALVFTALDDTWTFGDAIYHCLVVSEPL